MGKRMRGQRFWRMTTWEVGSIKE